MTAQERPRHRRAKTNPGASSRGRARSTAEAEHPVAQDGGWVSTKSIEVLLEAGSWRLAKRRQGAAVQEHQQGAADADMLSCQQQAILDAAAAAEKAKEEGAEVSETNPERRRSWTETLKEVVSDIIKVTVETGSSATSEFNNQMEQHQVIKKLEEIGLKKPDISPETEKCHSGSCNVCKTCQKKKAETQEALASLERVAKAAGKPPSTERQVTLVRLVSTKQQQGDAV